MAYFEVLGKVLWYFAGILMYFWGYFSIFYDLVTLFSAILYVFRYITQCSAIFLSFSLILDSMIFHLTLMLAVGDWTLH